MAEGGGRRDGPDLRSKAAILRWIGADPGHRAKLDKLKLPDDCTVPEYGPIYLGHDGPRGKWCCRACGKTSSTKTKIWHHLGSGLLSPARAICPWLHLTNDYDRFVMLPPKSDAPKTAQHTAGTTLPHPQMTGSSPTEPNNKRARRHPVPPPQLMLPPSQVTLAATTASTAQSSIPSRPTLLSLSFLEQQRQQQQPSSTAQATRSLAQRRHSSTQDANHTTALQEAAAEIQNVRSNLDGVARQLQDMLKALGTMQGRLAAVERKLHL
ncbi:uncharacterized protein MONBRDRAFT_6326 [Monosiga brevicollis MX1]|uniref:Uncharacterized protein n=1 Tax=Monosiga brevicollis TaxID=81824 RepID=A9UTI3_MONBE|nr:uncharacterized protein MONBRDRAFT_6326 [Monosiga brevicollis MX1]EDQ91498.1 predicted protein [Monosiga brevicollis MX1]|eukprot:XP_001743920.1 hypothetical protein [Monosiga brevicollis MX1]